MTAETELRPRSMRADIAEFPGVRLIEITRFSDERGWFAETYSRRHLTGLGIETVFVQDNHSLSRRTGVVRGLHFQVPPFAQIKLFSVLRGRILDVCVDIRRGSPTYRRHFAVELSAEAPRQLLVPAGFAHGFCTLAPDTEVTYKVSAFYSKPHDSGIRWDDPALGIVWPFGTDEIQISDKDRALPLFADAKSSFEFDG